MMVIASGLEQARQTVLDTEGKVHVVAHAQILCYHNSFVFFGHVIPLLGKLKEHVA